MNSILSSMNVKSKQKNIMQHKLRLLCKKVQLINRVHYYHDETNSHNILCKNKL